MNLLIVSIGIILLSGLASLATPRRPMISASLSAVGNILAALPGLYVSIKTLLTGETLGVQLPWSMPYGTASIEVDPLTACFLIPVFILSAVTSLYGIRYLTDHHQNKPVSSATFFFNMLAAAMIAVLVARNAIFFLIAWEVMSLSSFFLVTFYDDSAEVRQAGFTYLIATHIGTAFLMAFFIFMGMGAGSLDFATFKTMPAGSPVVASVLFILALVGFGTKAGLMPLHIWLPEAHPAAPSHVSALMSGVMIKTGIYGIIRTLTFLPEIQTWWGWLLIIVGALSGILGVLFAIAQHDIKRLLAYHSVENIGIITLGIGIGVLGISSALPVLAVAGFAGALLHVINHAFFKGLLFLGAGAVLHTTGTREIDKLGGLIRLMPRTAGAFLIGSIAICGLPPFNGFISEFMVYYGSFQGTIVGNIDVFLPGVCTIGSLALIGGLALACFTKSFGVIFLGEARSDCALRAKEVGAGMQCSMWILAAGCALIGLCAPLILPAFASVITQTTKLPPDIVAIQLNGSAALLSQIVLVVIIMTVFLILLAGLRHFLLRHQTIDRQVTWDCGYAKPSPRMQYTGASFAEPLVNFTRTILHTHQTGKMPEGTFPASASYGTHTPDVCHDYLFKPLFGWIDKVLDKLRWLQHGSIQLYILYIAATLIILMIWKLW